MAPGSRTIQQFREGYNRTNQDKSSQFQYPNKKWTNNIFRIQKDNNVTYLIPAYLRIKVKNIMAIDLSALQGQLNCSIILSILYDDKMEDIVLEYLKNSIELEFQQNDTIKLEKKNIEVIRKINEQNKIFKFTIRKFIVTRLEGDIFWSPFQKVKFIISCKLRNLRTQFEGINGIKYTFKFNLMDCDDPQTKLSISQQESKFGEFKISDRLLKVEYLNQFSLNKKSSNVNKNKIIKNENELQVKTPQKMQFQTSKGLQDQQQQTPLRNQKLMKNFQYALFQLYVYKMSGPTIWTVYFPLLLLGIINIAIFFQNRRQNGKILFNLSTLMVSFIALLPIVRKNTAVSPTVTFTQILVFLESITIILTLIHTINNRHLKDFKTDLNTDGLLIASIVITCFVGTCIVGLVLFHHVCLKNIYHMRKKQRHELYQQTNKKFNNKLWYNINCNQYYYNEVTGIQKYMMKRNTMKEKDWGQQCQNI